MGCDIHSYAEVYHQNSWKFIKDNIFTYGYYTRGSLNWGGINTHEPYGERNYYLFSLLADVRNYNNHITPISIPRGVPKNISKEVRKEIEQWASDGHSHSYFTLKELLEIKWDEEIDEEGYVDIYSYNTYMKNGAPYSWCRGVGGVEIITEDEMKQLITNNPDISKIQKSYYCYIKWKENLKMHCDTFVNNTLYELSLLGEPENVRLIFWFDN